METLTIEQIAMSAISYSRAKEVENVLKEIKAYEIKNAYAEMDLHERAQFNKKIKYHK